jgi:F0F1-type ATP synthase membrane subunit b/b'
MNKRYFFIVFLLAAQISFAQQGGEALQGNYPLNERFQILKSKSQTYNDYKVIKETVLDGFWKIIKDSIAAKQTTLRERQQAIAKLNTDLRQTQAALKEKETSMAAVVHDSTHITVLGIDFTKSVFISTVGIIFLILLVFLGLVSARLKMIHGSMRERADAFNSLSTEFEDYKRKAMEKQTKLSRELQNERNRLSDMRGV